MPISNIVVIVIRLFALNSLLQIPGLILSSVAAQSPGPSQPEILLAYLPVGLLLVPAACLWIFAPAIARFVSRGFDTSVSLGGLTRLDLYSFAFVFLGLYFLLSSVGDIINWIHYMAVIPQNNPARNVLSQNFYHLTRSSLTFAAGLVSLLGAPCWAKKLGNREQRAEAKA